MLAFLAQYGWAGAIATNLLIVWAGWSLRREFVTRADWTADRVEMGKRLDAIDGRVTAVEAQLSHVPTQEQFRELSEGVARLDERIKSVAETLVKIEGPLSIIVETGIKGALAQGGGPR